jgi:hypothetical protein
MVFWWHFDDIIKKKKKNQIFTALCFKCFDIIGSTKKMRVGGMILWYDDDMIETYNVMYSIT